MMAIRCAAKAVILQNNRILLNQCETERGIVYYTLPGGGQHPYETMEEAVVREVAEETGYRSEVVRFLAMTEEIHDDPVVRERFPDYTHRVLHIFLVRLLGEEAGAITETDSDQKGSVWMSLRDADTVTFRPASLSGQIGALASGRCAPFLGTTHTM
ncbi:MAG: NUDIX domain-containing protein [Clostridiaceae bacterium]|nr:NUDIX domain-containing protein [Clostridiaceae bacterium]